jgi:sulfide dehydrogenase [flavocytochrome c] flavoprotein subunit
VDIDWLSFESVNTPGVHVIGDAIFPAPTMPKSGHMANQHAKVRQQPSSICWRARRRTRSTPLVMNTCYSFVDSKNVIHVAQFISTTRRRRAVLPVAGAGGVSAAANELEGKYALAWAKNIWADMLV